MFDRRSKVSMLSKLLSELLSPRRSTRLKYRGLGDVTVFLLFGPMLMQVTIVIFVARMEDDKTRCICFVLFFSRTTLLQHEW